VEEEVGRTLAITGMRRPKLRNLRPKLVHSLLLVCELRLAEFWGADNVDTLSGSDSMEFGELTHGAKQHLYTDQTDAGIICNQFKVRRGTTARNTQTSSEGDEGLTTMTEVLENLLLSMDGTVKSSKAGDLPRRIPS
jgi:hypothetical protein